MESSYSMLIFFMKNILNRAHRKAVLEKKKLHPWSNQFGFWKLIKF